MNYTLFQNKRSEDTFDRRIQMKYMNYTLFQNKRSEDTFVLHKISISPLHSLKLLLRGCCIKSKNSITFRVLTLRWSIQMANISGISANISGQGGGGGGCTSSLGMEIYLSRNAHPHREWECASREMHILTGNAYPHREYT